MIEIVQFFKLDDSNMQTTILWAYKLYKYARRNSLVLVDHIMSQTLRINFKVDVKGPYIVFPEHGSIQKCVTMRKVNTLSSLLEYGNNGKGFLEVDTFSSWILVM